MKRLVFLLGASLCNLVNAQQTPSLPPKPAVLAPPSVSVMRPEYANPAAPPAAGTPMVTTAPTELRDLIRAQTEAIRGLSAKVDVLEERLRRIESRIEGRLR